MILCFNSCVVGCVFFLQGIQRLPLQTLYGHDSEVGEIIVMHFSLFISQLVVVV